MKVIRPRCTFCGKEGVISLPYARLVLCEDHLEEYLVKRVKKVPLPKRLVAAVSGGKDSVAMLYLLKKAGVDVMAVTVETLPLYTTYEASIAKSVAEELGVEHVTVYAKELYGVDARDHVRVRRKPCSLCSLLRRHALEVLARSLGVEYVATGHNADDMASLALSSILKRDVGALRKVVPVEEPSPPARGRVRPLFWVPERDALALVLTKRLPWARASCPLYEQGSLFLDSVREFIMKMESEHPGIRFNLLKMVLETFAGRGEGLAFRACKRCGAPTLGDVCQACKLRERFGTPRRTGPALRPKMSVVGEGNVKVIMPGKVVKINMKLKNTRVRSMLKELGLSTEEAVVVVDGVPVPYEARLVDVEGVEIYTVARINPSRLSFVL